MLKEKSEFLKNVEDSPFWVDELAGNLRYFEFDYVRCNYYLIYNETERKYNITPWEDETYTFLVFGFDAQSGIICVFEEESTLGRCCLLYTSDAADDQ